MIMHSSLPLSVSNSHTHKYFVSSLGDGFQKIPSQKTCWGGKGEKKKKENKNKVRGVIRSRLAAQSAEKGERNQRTCNSYTGLYFN